MTQKWLQSFCNKRLKLPEQCGVHNVADTREVWNEHGMCPGANIAKRTGPIYAPYQTLMTSPYRKLRIITSKRREECQIIHIIARVTSHKHGNSIITIIRVQD